MLVAEGSFDQASISISRAEVQEKNNKGAVKYLFLINLLSGPYPDNTPAMM